MKLISLVIYFFSAIAVAKTADYKSLPFLDENIKVGLGMTYSKLENSSDVGNYFLLSQANPRLELQYDSSILDKLSHRIDIYAEQMVYRPENSSLILKYSQAFLSYGISLRSRWISEGEGFAYGFKIAGKSAAVISELPQPLDVRGDIATRYSAEAGLCFVWFGQTVAKLPLSIDFEILYSGTLGSNSALTYKSGSVYRFGIEFDFGKRSVLSNWNLRGAYSYEDVKNDYKSFADKEIGFTINKVFFF